MARKPTPTNVLELRGAYLRHPERRPRSPLGNEPAMTLVSRLVEARLDVPQICPASVRDVRGQQLWEAVCKRMLEANILTRESLVLLERYVLVSVGMWMAADAGKPVRAAVSRELGALEAKLFGAAPLPGARPGTPENRFSAIARAFDSDRVFCETDPKAWQARCRREAAEALALASRLRRDKAARRRLLAKYVERSSGKDDTPL
jgi:hypothetical protein